MTEQYIYQVARVRCRELNLLTKQDIDALLGTKGYENCIRTLFDKGFGEGTETSAEEILEHENKKLWDFMDELLKDKSVFEILVLPTDYNNLKAAIKSSISNTAFTGIFKDGGNIDSEVMVSAVKNNDFSVLPKTMADAAQKAYKNILHTRDGQICDVILDTTCLKEILKSGKNSSDQLIKDYAEIYVALANIKTAVRCQRTHKTLSFVKDALVECKTLNISALATVSTKTEDELLEFLSHTAYSDCTEKLSESNSSFEKWCDDRLMALVKKQKVNPFTLGPLVAYVIARQIEMGAVKIILSGKLNDIDDEIIKERLREMYV